MKENNLVYISCQEDNNNPIWLEKVEPFVHQVLTKLEKKLWDLSIVFCQDPFIKDLNYQYRKIDAPTDVLSFEAGNTYTDEYGIERFLAGDIVISIDTLFRNADEFNVAVDEELKRLLIHGILHLSGMDHSDNSPEQEMLKLQESILTDLLKETDIIIKD